MDSLFRAVMIGVALLGTPFAAIGACEAIDTRRELSSFARAQGAVTGNRLTVDQRDGREERAYQPEVSFQTRDGRKVHFTDGVGSLPPDYTVGDAVDVLYDPAHVERARIISWKRLWLVPSLLIGVGFLPGIVAAIVFTALSAQAASGRAQGS